MVLLQVVGVWVVMYGSECRAPEIPVDEVVSRVVAAGGTLRIADPDADTRAAWRRAIQAVIRGGQHLHYTGRLKGDLVIALPDDPHAAPRTVERVRARPSRGRWHPVVVELRARATGSAGQGAAGDVREVRLPQVPASVLPRALRLLHRLFSEAERRGHQVRLAAPSDATTISEVCIVIGRHQYPITVTAYHGVMIVRLLGIRGGRRYWGDGKVVMVEQKIGHMLDSLEFRARRVEQHRAERERAAAERLRRMQPLIDQARAEYAMDFASGVLRGQVADWRLAADIRSMCEHVHQRILDGRGTAADEAWLDWAREHADRLDPANRPLKVPPIPAPALRDLTPYLKTRHIPALEARS